MMCSNFYFIGSFLYNLPNIHYCSHSSLLCALFFILIRIKSTATYWYLHRFRESMPAVTVRSWDQKPGVYFATRFAQIRPIARVIFIAFLKLLTSNN